MKDARHAVLKYQEAQNLRSVFEDDWRRCALYCSPIEYMLWNNSAAAFSINSLPETRRRNYDSGAQLALMKYRALLLRLAVPGGSKWHALAATDRKLMKSPRVREYFETVTNIMFHTRYEAPAGFGAAQSELYKSLGVYGSGCKFVERREPSAMYRNSGLRYVTCAMRDMFFLMNSHYVIDTVFRRMMFNARQIRQIVPAKYPLPKRIQSELDKPTPSESTVFHLVHCVYPAEDYDRSRLDVNRFPYRGRFLFVEENDWIGEEVGFSSMPYITPRIDTVPGTIYGSSPAMSVLGACGSASAIKLSMLKQGQKAAEPVILAHDDAVLNKGFDNRPGSIIYGGMSAEGRPLVSTLPVGDIRVSELLLEHERRDINDSFFVTLFQILIETPEMTATEVLERASEKAALIAPTMHDLQTEDLEPTIMREYTILGELGRLPPPPQELIEAGGAISIQFTSPLAKSLAMEQVVGFQHLLRLANEIAASTGSADIFQLFDFETALPEISDILGAPISWLADAKMLGERKAAQQQAQDRQDLVDAAPAIASTMKGMNGRPTGS